MDDEHVIIVTISNNKILKEIKKATNKTSCFKEFISDVRTVQKSTNDFLTELVENEKLDDATQKRGDEDVDDEDDDEDEIIAIPHVGSSLSKRKSKKSTKTEKKLRL